LNVGTFRIFTKRIWKIPSKNGIIKNN